MPGDRSVCFAAFSKFILTMSRKLGSPLGAAAPARRRAGTAGTRPARTCAAPLTSVPDRAADARSAATWHRMLAALLLFGCGEGTDFVLGGAREKFAAIGICPRKSCRLDFTT
jgi:hypothetical protein